MARARHLLGARVVRGEQLAAGPREVGRDGRIQRLRDAEIHELDRAVRRREDVARLEVAVHDQAPVGRGDRLADVTEDPKARGDVQLVAVAVAIDPLPVHVLHREVRKPVVGEAAVEELRDAGMREPGQDLPLGDEARALVAVERALNHLQGHVAVVLPVGAPREVDGPHPAVPDLAHDGIRTDAPSRPIAHPPIDRPCAELDGKALERTIGAGVRVEQRPDLAAKCRIAAARVIEKRGPRMIRQGERLLEQALEP